MRRIWGLFVFNHDKSCPRCGSMHVHRTKRGRVLEFWVLLFISVRPYRCGKCRLRFYGPKRFDPDAPVPDPHFGEEAPLDPGFQSKIAQK